ncbi:hypothetical protein BU15DRAFT_68829 [Melanogaster broomeanus]|nr:hypothetical protein BU15DRAFT_68829 [Melanogaster broomeanus]
MNAGFASAPFCLAGASDQNNNSLPGDMFEEAPTCTLYVSFQLGPFRWRVPVLGPQNHMSSHSLRRIPRKLPMVVRSLRHAVRWRGTETTHVTSGDACTTRAEIWYKYREDLATSEYPSFKQSVTKMNEIYAVQLTPNTLQDPNDGSPKSSLLCVIWLGYTVSECRHVERLREIGTVDVESEGVVALNEDLPLRHRDSSTIAISSGDKTSSKGGSTACGGDCTDVGSTFSSAGGGGDVTAAFDDEAMQEVIGPTAGDNKSGGCGDAGTDSVVGDPIEEGAIIATLLLAG